MHDLPPSGARGVLLTPTIHLRIGPVVQYQRTSALPLKAEHVSATQPRTMRGRTLHRRGAGLRRPPVQIFPFLYFSSLSWMDTGGWLYSESNPRSQSAYPLSPFVIRTLHCYRRAPGRAVVTLPLFTSLWCIVVGAKKHLDHSGDEACGPLVGEHAQAHGQEWCDLTALNRFWLTSAQGIEARSWQWIQAQTWTARDACMAIERWPASADAWELYAKQRQA
ncbi:hypothetical protein B0H14DRAFT_2705803 [Mycena olivaceomarginata]|nr:hypothetical protein B0H14DRAFT_2705803 [Mycena olivaceomarginata]